MIWGESDASVHFCEENYNDYVAEIFNTTSSIFYILVGVYFIETPLYRLAYSTIGVGVGSMLLHGTQRKYAQWVDEISMLCLIFFAMRQINKKMQDIYIFPIIFFYLCFSNVFPIFIGTFGLAQSYVIPRAFSANMDGKLYSILFLSGFYFWLLDQLACEYVKDMYFHAWWHLLSALSIFFGFKAILKY